MTDLALPPDLAPAPTTLFASDDPAVIVARATRIADAIAPLIRERALVKRIGASEHVYLEGWTLAGTMLGVFATTVRTWEIGDDDGYGATVEARTMGGSVVGRADAVVMRSEEVGGKRKWLEAPAFQLISMAQTRASSKSLRMPLGFVMKLAGYETTPAEEMEAAAARGETVSGGRGVAAGWHDLHEQNNAHARLNVFLANNGLGEWVAVWLDSKGYQRPLSKPQMSELRRAVDRELAERATQSGAGSSPAGSGDVPSGSSAPATGPPTPDPSAQEASPTEAGRARVEGGDSNHGTSKPGAGTSLSDAPAPPGGAGRSPSWPALRGQPEVPVGATPCGGGSNRRPGTTLRTGHPGRVRAEPGPGEVRAVTTAEAALRCERLTGREREILQATADGLSTREVARQLYISIKTVNTHLVNLHRKLGTQSKVQAVVAGIKAGVVQL